MNNELLKQLYRQYYKEIYLYLFSLSKNAQMAEDLVQETFLKALLSLQDSHTNMRAWLYMVARNLYFNERKKNERNTPLENLNDTIADEKFEEPYSGLIMEEKSVMLHKAISRLNERCREVLVLQYFSGLSQKAIGKVLNLSPENVRVISLRGRQKLKKELEAMGYEI